MGVRRLLALLDGIPPGSALHRAVDPDGWAWTTTEELMASLIEVADFGNRWYIAAHIDSKKGGKVPDAIRVPRPGERRSPVPDVPQPKQEPVPVRPRPQSKPDDIKRLMGGSIHVTPKGTP